MLRTRLFALVAGASVLVGSPLHAQSIFSTFGPNFSYDTGFRYGDDGNSLFQAFHFVPTATDAIERVTVALGRTAAGQLAVQFNLHSGTPSAIGPLLESFVVPNAVTPGVSPGAVVTFSSVVRPVLVAGQSYWLSFTEPDPPNGASSLWFFNNQGLRGTRITSALPAGQATLPAFSVEVGSMTAPLPPTGLEVAAVVGSRATMRWTPPAGGLAPTGYVVEGGVTPGQTLASFDLPPTFPIVALNVPLGSFFVRTRARVGALLSAPSGEVPLTTLTGVAPSAPTHFTGAVNGSALSLHWKNTFGGGIPTGTGLDVTGAFTGSLPLGAAESFNVAGVPNGTYTFSVRTTNAGGTSPASPSVTLTFPGACSGLPNAPERFLASSQGNVLSLLWDPPAGGPAPTGYAIVVGSGPFAGQYAIGITRLLNVPLPSGTYRLAVRALNACGFGATTSEQQVALP